MLWLLLEGLWMLFYAGMHPSTALAVLFVVLAFALGMWPLRPHRAGLISVAVGWLLAGILTVFAPLSVSTLWLDAVGTVRSGTVVESHYHPGYIRRDRNRRHSRPATLTYAVRTDDGRRFGPSLLDKGDLGSVEVGDRVQLRVDPAGIFGPQGERRRHDVIDEIGVWLAVVAAAGLVALEVRVRVRRRRGIVDDEGG